MTVKDLLQFRLANQFIINSPAKTPYEVVSGLGAVQAQDYLGALWAVGVRTIASPQKLSNDPSDNEAKKREKTKRKNSLKESVVEQALSERKILRTWPMRGTLHFVASEDARWMLDLMAQRILSRSAGTYRKEGLTETEFNKCQDLIIKSLEGGRALTRDEFYKTLNDEGIATSDQRGLHIIGYLAMNKIICFGARVGKQQTFVLLDEWVPAPRVLTKEESLAEIALRYFTSHGPATLNDFVWWTGLLVTDAKRAIESVKNNLSQKIIEGQVYWMKQGLPDNASYTKSTFLLPPYDEFLISYSDRSAAVDKKYSNEIMTKNGIFNPIIVKEGKVLGIWRRTLGGNEVTIELLPFGPLSKGALKEIEGFAEFYSDFIGKELKEVVTSKPVITPNQ
jgi:hypothetical protein